MEQAHTRRVVAAVAGQRAVDNRVDRTGTRSSEAQLLCNRAIWRTTFCVTNVKLHALYSTSRFTCECRRSAYRICTELDSNGL